MLRAPVIIALATVFALAACGDDAARPTRASTAAVDPVLVAALADPIMVDPDLGGQANGDALRPPDRPPSGILPPLDIAPMPPVELPTRHAPAARGDCADCALARRSLTLGALAAALPDPDVRACATDIRYSARWAARMPAAAPLPPDARVLVAAGTDKGQCRLRAVRFTSAAPVTAMIDFYAGRARAAGMSVSHSADGDIHALDGTTGIDGGTVTVVARPRASGSLVDLVARGSHTR